MSVKEPQTAGDFCALLDAARSHLDGRIADLTSDCGIMDRRIGELHQRLRPLEAYHQEAIPIRQQLVDAMDRRIVSQEERWQAMDREITRLRTTIALAGTAICIILPIGTALAVRLIGTH